MKKIIFGIIFSVFLVESVFTQSPEKISYQAIIRNSSNTLVSLQGVGVQITILQGSVSGLVVYRETHDVTTDQNGLISLEIGSGVIKSGVFSAIDWSNGPYFIQTETDPTVFGGTNYTIKGTTQFLSVPYALHAETASSIVGGVPEQDPVFNASIASSISVADTANWNHHTVDTDTHIDSIGIANLGFVAGAHTVDTDTHIDSVGIANLGFVAGTHTVDTDTHIDSVGIANLGFVTGAHTVDTDTHIDSVGIANLGFVAGAHAVDTDTHIDSVGVVNLGFVAGEHKTYVAGNNISIVGNVINASGSNGNTFVHYLGEDYLGGIIYYLYRGSDGLEHGLIVSKTEAVHQWCQPCGPAAYSGDNGKYNTGLMSGSAAKQYVQSLGPDWYIPSADEFVLLFQNRYHVIRALYGLGIQHNLNKLYWTSTQYSSSNVKTFSGVTGTFSYKKRYLTAPVRAIKEF